MATLNGIAENIAFRLGEQFNDTLKESIKADFISLRALFVRRDLERNPLSYIDYLQSICLELEEADKSYCEGLKTGCIVKVSKQEIAKPVRIKNNGRTNFHFVGTIDKSISYSFTTQHEMQFNCHLPLQGNTIYYGYRYNKLVVYNNPHACKVLLEYVVDDPREIDDCNYPNTFKDDLEFAIPSDMITEISDLIVRQRRLPIDNGKEVKIEEKDA